MDSENKKRTQKPDVHHASLVDCTRLNVRSAAFPEASVVGVLDEQSYIKVNMSESQAGFLNILEPVYGYAMAKYLKVD